MLSRLFVQYLHWFVLSSDDSDSNTLRALSWMRFPTRVVEKCLAIGAGGGIRFERVNNVLRGTDLAHEALAGA